MTFLLVLLLLGLHLVFSQHQHVPGDLVITHAHDGQPEHTHVNIHQDGDFAKKKCSVAGSVCVPLTHCSPVCHLLHAPKDLKIQRFVRDLHCGFHYSESMVCCPIDEISETAACNLNVKTLSDPIIDVESLIETLAQNNTEPLGCGQKKVVGRIFGGEKAGPGEWPWMALLWYEDKTKDVDYQYFHGCGGTLISRHYILTAGHCIQLQSPYENSKLVTVRLGENDVNQNNDCSEPDTECVCQEDCLYSSVQECLFQGDCAPQHQDYGVLHAFAHPDFARRGNGQMINDIGLVRLDRGVKVSNYISPICLPDFSDPDITKGTATGWGDTNKDFGPVIKADILQQAEVELVEREDCEKKWNRKLEQGTGSSICVQGSNGGEGLCQGDSGGPLVYEVGPVFVQLAILSAGSNFCGDTRKPSFYCPIKDFVSWIKQTINEPLAVRYDR